MDNQIINSVVDDTAKIYKDVYIRDCKIGKSCLVADRATLLNVELTEHNEVGKDCYIQDTKFGIGSYIGHASSISHKTTIGKYCNLAYQLVIGGYNHLYLATSEYTNYWWKRIFDQTTSQVENQKGVNIGNDVWIGANATILDGLTIGDGAVVGAGAVVTKDIEPYTIVVGNPAKPLKKRFDDEIIKELLELKWWDWDFDKIKRCSKLLSKPLTKEILKQLKEAK